MLTIYSIGRAVSSSRISFPSVFSGGGDWEIGCRGGSLRGGEDFLIFGEMREVGGSVMLALSFADAVNDCPYFCRAAGVAAEDGWCGGWDIGRRGGFTGEVFAVEDGRLLLSGGSFAGGEDESLTRGEGVDKKLMPVIPRAAVAVAVAGVGRATESDKIDTPDSVRVENKEAVASQGAPGVDILRVLKSVEAEEFPVADALPELAAVKRDDLARKAESRRKDDGKVTKKSTGGEQKVSKGGLRLGKDSPGDKPGAGGHNTIDESELW